MKGSADVTVLGAVTVMQWLWLAAALMFYAGPGVALAAASLRVERRLDFTQTLIVGFAVSISLWAVVFSALTLLDLALPPWSAWLASLVGWAGYGWLRQRRQAQPVSQSPLLQDRHWLPTALLWAVVALAAAVSLWALRGIVVQPGSDGYHHTLIAQEIAAQGRLPNGFAPLTPLLTFTYHFGYHSFVAVIEWMTGVSAVSLVPILAQLLKAAAALAVAFLTEAIGERRSGSVIAAAVTGLICVFPAYYVNWGRNTQVAGLVLLAVLLGVVWLWCGARLSWSTAGLLVLLAVGLVFVHYRVTLMAALGCLLIVLGRGWQARWNWAAWRLRIWHGVVMAGGVLLLALPWLLHVRGNQDVGYPAIVPEPQVTFFTLSRMGDVALSYWSNTPLLILLALALAWGLWKRSLGVWIMLLWGLLMYTLSQPWAANEYMDTVSVVQSLFVPGAVILGLSAVLFWRADGSARRWRHWLLAALTAGLSLAGAGSISRIVEQGAVYVLPQDMAAVRWVSEHTPPDALFMVNTYTFNFMPEYVIGSDAGGWLPVLAGRRVVTAPMTYPIERLSVENYPQLIRRLAEMSSNLAGAEAVAELRRLGVTHVFIGQRGGPISAAQLLDSPAYSLEFQDGDVYVFRLLGG